MVTEGAGALHLGVALPEFDLARHQSRRWRDAAAAVLAEFGARLGEFTLNGRRVGRGRGAE